MVKKIISFLILLSLFFPLLASAIEIPNPLRYDTFGELIKAIMDFLFIIALILGPLLIIVGAFYIMTALGNPEKVKTGTKIIIYTLVGFLIIIIARGLVNTVLRIIGAPESA